MSRPHLAALRPSGTQNRAHANKPTPEREHQPSKRGRGGGTTLPRHPQASAHKQARKHEREHEKAQPNHPPSKHAHNKPCCHPHANTNSAHATARGRDSVSTRGDP